MEWPERWEPIDDRVSSAFLAELEREVTPGHCLFGLPVRAVGRRLGTDDVIFVVEDGSGRVAAVHLTWKNAAERPPWPSARLYDNWRAWVSVAQKGS